ncbi:C2 calcium-dependent domain-containing protein 4C-like [Sphaeramia orbicularis]|uniref:C2 calcium-dependent domain-containing protein 4C-like n=1 Tax=Sphaeramia orbicularis TaxID=375764 RepID=UPI001180B2A5|nr:C2 calcium-dependent domain-containing protein 4C-like [Sphaeramia orbicularis]
MSSLKSGSGLRSLVLTPERIPSFLIPSLHIRSPVDRLRLLSDSDHSSSADGSPEKQVRDQEDMDTDVTTRAAMSLPHVKKATTPYGFRAVLAASPCTNRRESLFHKNKPLKDQGSDNSCDLQMKSQDLDLQSSRDASDPMPPPSPKPSRSRECLRPVRALGLQVMKELRKPAAALRALSPAARRTEAH